MPIITTSANLRLATWRNIFVIIDAGEYRVAEYAECERTFNEHADACGGSAGFLTVIPAGARQPSEEARNAISGCFDRMSRKMFGLVWAVEGTGFNASMVRATLTTISLARRRAYPTRVSSNVTEGLGWLMVRKPTSGFVDVAAGLAVVDAARAPISQTFRTAAVAAPSSPRFRNSA